jgi:hypothetical protein
MEGGDVKRRRVGVEDSVRVFFEAFDHRGGLRNLVSGFAAGALIFRQKPEGSAHRIEVAVPYFIVIFDWRFAVRSTQRLAVVDVKMQMLGVLISAEVGKNACPAVFGHYL